jgi:LmbE family N-acetylglucosaminyl deacetylase
MISSQRACLLVVLAHPDDVAVSFDASSLVQRKFMALAAHRSAFGVTEEMLHGPPPRRAGDA